MGLFADCTWNSAVQLLKGETGANKGFMAKHGGKLLVGSALLATIVGVSNVLISRHKPSKVDSANIIEDDRKYVVN